MNSSKSTFKPLFKLLSMPETLLFAVAAGLIQFQIEGVLMQTVASIVFVAAALLMVLGQSNTFKSTIGRDWMRFLGVFTMFGFVFVSIYNPVPAHAILLKAQDAVVAGIKAGVPDPVVQTWAVGTIVTVLWVSRAILLAVAVKMGMDVLEGRKEEQPWKDLLQKPITFFIVVGVVNQIGTMLTT